MAYVYQHIRLDTNEVFYIGIGKTRYRARAKQGRNDMWYKIVEKSGFRYEIIIDNVTWKEACQLEIELIKKHGRKNNGTGILANMTDGGDGNLGLKHSPEALKKISASSKGRSGYWKGKKMPKEMGEKLSAHLKGKPRYDLRGRIVSEDARQKMRVAKIGHRYNVGIPLTEERKRKISDANKGRVAYNKGKPGLAGELNGMYGRKHSEESIQKNKNSQKKKPVLKCDIAGTVLEEYISLAEAGNRNGLFISGIQAVCKGRVKTYKGYIWRYK